MVKPVGFVIATVSFLAHGSSSEFSAPDHERFIEETALLQIRDETDNGLIDISAEPGVVDFHLGVAVPLASRPVVELDKADSPLHEASRHEALPAVGLGVFVVESVQSFDSFGFTFQIDGFGSFGLHPEGEFIAADPGIEVGVRLPAEEMVLVELIQEIEFFSLPHIGYAARIIEIRNRLGLRFQRAHPGARRG